MIHGSRNLVDQFVQLDPPRTLGANDSTAIYFRLPSEFAGLLAASLVGVPDALAAVAAQDIGLSIERGGEGDQRARWAVSSALAADLTGRADLITAIADLAPLLPGEGAVSEADEVGPDQFCALEIAHIGIAGTVTYLGIRLEYVTR